MIDNEASDFSSSYIWSLPGIYYRTPALLDLYKWPSAWCNFREYIIATLRRGALDKNCEIFIFDRCLHGGSSYKISFGPWGHEKRELANDHTIFETCILNPFHGQKIKKNLSWTGSREDRS